MEAETQKTKVRIRIKITGKISTLLGVSWGTKIDFKREMKIL